MFFTLLCGFSIGYFVSNISDLKTVVSLILQKIYIPNTLEKIARHTYKLSYSFHGKHYHILLHMKRGPSLITRIVDEGWFVVTDRVKQYLGPNEDGHRNICSITPHKLGFKELHISTMDGSTTTFKDDDEIIL